MTNYNIVFEEKQYRSVTNRAAEYYRENAVTSSIPLCTQPIIPDSLEYTHVMLSDPNSSRSGQDWTVGRFADTQHEPTTINLYSQMMDIFVNVNEISKFGEWLIGDKKQAEIKKFAETDIDHAILHGPANENEQQLAEGIIGQLTSVQDLNGTDSDLSTKGYIWKALNTLIDEIPFALRASGPDMICMMSEHLYAKVTAPDRVYMDQIEWDFIKKNLQNENAQKGRRIGQFIVTNKILAEASDDTDGANADTADTEGTHDRLFLFVPDPMRICRVISRGFSLIDEQRVMLGVHQLYGWRGRGYVFDTDCAAYSEAITWS